MHACRIEPDSWDMPDLQPADGELERLQRVLRLKEGEIVPVFDGCGRSGRARLVSGGQAGRMRLLLVQGESGMAAPPLPVVLFQAIPKSARMDWLVEKATELGVAGIAPMVSQRGIVRPRSANDGGNRVQRWQRLARQAARQCGMPTVPAVETPIPFDAAIDRARELHMTGVYGSLEADAVTIRTALSRRDERAGNMALFIGPEGDFTPDEYQRLRDAGMIPINLGPRILRVETAALAALSIIGYELEHL